MPRRSKRFSSLFERLKKLEGKTPTAGTDEANFLDFLQGKRNIEVKNKVPEGAKKRFNVTVIPFALSATSDVATERYKAPISVYSYVGLTERTALAITDFGIKFVEDGNQTNPNFYPALIKPTYSSEASNAKGANPVSAVTNKSYNYKRTRSFSVPFGRTTTAKDAKSGADETALNNVDELDVLRTLREKMDTQTNPDNKPLSIGYEPELFKPQISAKDAKDAANIPVTGIQVN